MIVMPSNNTSGLIHYLSGAYPGSIGLLISPNGWRQPPWYMPYALDNGAFTGFDEENFLRLLGRVAFTKHKPLWVAVPDRVADAETTNKLWHKWKDKINHPLAFVAQDGHEPNDIPKEAFAVFIGGSTGWKINNAHRFKGVAKWLHIGRVNTLRRLEWARDTVQADSVDGTGFLRSKRQRQDLMEFITGKGQLKLFKERKKS